MVTKVIVVRKTVEPRGSEGSNPSLSAKIKRVIYNNSFFIKKISVMNICSYGCNTESKFFFKNGKGCCSSSPNKCAGKRNKDSTKKKGSFNGKPFWKIEGYEKKAWNKGLKTNQDTKNKISLSLTGKSTGRATTDENENIRRLKISSTMKKNQNAGGIRQGAGYGKGGWYKGYWCDSTWELAWVIYHIDNNINFNRNKKGFDYVYQNTTNKYYPDFIIDEIYYEIKGRRCYDDLDDKTKCKINQFNEKLIILYEDDIKKYLKYTISNYGKNFIELYENKLK